MSAPLSTFDWWESGTTQPSIPVNNNALRTMIGMRGAVSDSVTAQPTLTTPDDDGLWYIIPAGATGSQWSTFGENSCAIFFGGNWYEFVPEEGDVVSVDCTLYCFSPSSGWTAISSGGGSGSPGGSDTQVQFNDGGSFGGNSALTFNKTTGALTQGGALNEAKGTNIASASTTDIGAASGTFIHITGTTTITALGTIQAGARRIVTFDGALTLTHNGTSLILPTSANITTAPGDVATFVSEGSGNWRCVGYLRANGQSLAGSGGLTNWTDALSTAVPNNTRNTASLKATGSATNIDAVISPKGNGALSAQVPDNTSAGGNKRGTAAVDWQMIRSFGTESATGNSSVIGGGERNSAGSLRSTIAGGFSNTTGGDYASIGGGNANIANGAYSTVSGGSTASASADYSVVGGGLSNTSSGNYSVISGGQSNTSLGAHSGVTNGQGCLSSGSFSRAGGQYATARGIRGADAYASGQFATTGDAQRRTFVQFVSTTNATPADMTADGSAVSSSNIAVLPNNSTFAVQGTVVVRENATGDCKAIKFEAVVRRGANAAATALVSAATVTTISEDAGAATWAISVGVDTFYGAVKVSVTGEASHNLKWVARMESVEVVG